MKGAVFSADELPASNMKEATLYPEFTNGFLYIIQADDQIVKVGKTVDPRNRLKSHFREIAKYGRTPTRYWLSPKHWTYGDNEKGLLERVSKFAGLRATSREFFTADFDLVVQEAEALEFPCINEEEKATKHHTHWAEMRHFIEESGSTLARQWPPRELEPERDIRAEAQTFLADTSIPTAAWDIANFDDLIARKQALIDYIERRAQQLAYVVTGDPLVNAKQEAA